MVIDSVDHSEAFFDSMDDCQESCIILNSPEFSMLQISHKIFNNYPNPFNPETKIDYRIPKGTIFRIEIIDIQGKLVKTLIHDKISQGDGQVKWDGRETGGFMLPSGIYFYRLSSPDFIQTKKIVLLR